MPQMPLLAIVQDAQQKLLQLPHVTHAVCVEPSRRERFTYLLANFGFLPKIDQRPSDAGIPLVVFAIEVTTETNDRDTVELCIHKNGDEFVAHTWK